MRGSGKCDDKNQSHYEQYDSNSSSSRTFNKYNMRGSGKLGEKKSNSF